MSETVESNVKQERSTDMLCHTVAKGISEMVRFSVDEDFRKHLFQIMRVKSTNDMENKIYERLLASTEKTNSVNELSSSDDDIDEETPKCIQHSNTGQSSATGSKSKLNDEEQNLSPIYRQNWLKMSIRKEKHIRKKRKLYVQNQDLNHHQLLFPNHSLDYTSNTPVWDFNWHSQ